MKVRTRFAPSPTGFMHVGGIRTALFAWAYAKNQGGEFLLRIEDTDKNREVAGSIEHIQDSLKWLGLAWDEGPDKSGPFGPYIQSERLAIYKVWAEKLIEAGLAYSDDTSKEQLDAYRQAATEAKKAFLFRDHRPTETKVEANWYGRLPLRLKITDVKDTVWQDEVRGELHAGAEALDDFILIKADGYPTYNFAHVVDDFLMKISHVMRGEEFIASTPKFIALHEALNIPMPKFATMPPILAKEGNRKLSKRDGAKDVLDYRSEGLFPEAVVNFISSLGWNDGTEEEIFTPQEIVARFKLDRIQKSGARFSEEKLAWVNWQHAKKLAGTDTHMLLAHITEHFAFDTNFTNAVAVCRLAVTKAASMEELIEQLKIFSEDKAFTLDSAKLTMIDQGLTTVVARQYLAAAITVLEGLPDFSKTEIETALRAKMAELQAQPRAFLNLIRWSISASSVSPNLFEMIEIIGKPSSLKRLQATLDSTSS